MTQQFQDWTPLVLRKTPKLGAIKKTTGPMNITHKGVSTELLARFQGGSNTKKTKIKSDINMRKLEDGEIEKLPIVSSELRISIQKARTDKKLTQVQLANLCNLPIKIIQNYENGTALFNNNEIQIIGRKLGVQLKK